MKRTSHIVKKYIFSAFFTVSLLTALPVVSQEQTPAQDSGTELSEEPASATEMASEVTPAAESETTSESTSTAESVLETTPAVAPVSESAVESEAVPVDSPTTESVVESETASETPAMSEQTDETSLTDESEQPKKSIVPASKRPRKPDGEKARLAESKDIGKNAVKDKQDTLRYGIEGDILELLKELSDNDDPRFVEEIYDLFQNTKSGKIKIAILDYFAKLEDPCIEDFAVTILNDPYDEKTDLISSVFKYTAAVKCKAAVSAVMTLLENDNETYFDNSLNTIGSIGGEEEAVILAGYLEREDLSLSQRQTLMKVLGNIKAVSTWDTLVEIVQNDDENVYVRSYAAEAIGAMQKEESIPILKELFESDDPTLRTYALKGLAHFERNQVSDIFVEAVRDSYYKVRLEAISSIDKLKIKDAMDTLIYRAKNDPEAAVKKACYPVIAKLDTSDGNDFLIGLITDKKTGDNTKALVVDAIMENQHSLPKEITALAEEVVKDDMRKPLRYAIGKQFVKQANMDYLSSEFAHICVLYMQSKDVSTQGIGIDLYAAGRYASASETIHKIAEDEKKSANKTKARKILKMDEE